MLYNTHTRYGQVFGLGGLLVAENLGTFDEIGLVSTVVTVGVAMLGARFGAEFPDIDSKGSKPAQKHKILRQLFKAFGVTHRGRFSHDVVVQTLFWSLILYLLTFLTNAVGNDIFTTVAQTYVIFTWLGVMSHLFADALTVEGIYVGLIFKITLMPVWVKGFNFLGWKPFKKAFTAGSSWNDMHYNALTFIVPVLLVFTLITIF